jgi:hypothetical protein
VAITYNTKNVEEFFSAHPSQNIIANQLASYVKRKNAEENILQKIVNENGFAHWDKTMQKEKNTFRPTANGDSTDVYYVPIAQPNTANVNSSVVITTTPTDTTLGFTYDWQYTAQASSNTIMGDACEQYAILFMYMNKTVFGQPSYKILDPTLFNLNGQKPISITITSNGNNSSTSGLLQQQVCIIVSTTYNTCPYLAAGQQCVVNSLLPSGTGTCDNCSYCTTTVTNTYCVENCHSCGGGTTGNGNTNTNTNNNSNINTGNGNTGGSGSGTTNGNTTTNGGNTNPNGGSGWTPNGDEGPLTPCERASLTTAHLASIYAFGINPVASTIDLSTEVNEKGFFVYQTWKYDPVLLAQNQLVRIWGPFITSPISTGTPTKVLVNDSVPPRPPGVNASKMGMLHIHLKNGYAPHSPDDIYGLLSYQLEGQTGNNVYEKRYAGNFVLAANGSKYAITISDTAAAKAFLSTKGANLNPLRSKWKDGTEIRKEFDKVFRDTYKTFIPASATATDFTAAGNKAYEIAMAVVLKNFNTGITLSKANTYGTFKPIMIKITVPDATKPDEKTYAYECS